MNSQSPLAAWHLAFQNPPLPSSPFLPRLQGARVGKGRKGTWAEDKIEAGRGREEDPLNSAGPSR